MKKYLVLTFILISGMLYGQQWQELQPGQSPIDLENWIVFKGKIYCFSEYANQHRIMTYDGVKWDSIQGWQKYGSGFFREPVTDGEYLFFSIGKEPIQNTTRYILRYDGSTYQVIDSTTLGIGSNSLAIYNNELLYLGSADSSGKIVQALYRYNGVTKTRIPIDHITELHMFCQIADKLYCQGIIRIEGTLVYGIFTWDGTTWQTVSETYPAMNISAGVDFNGLFTLGGDLNVMFPPPGSSPNRMVSTWTGAAWAPIGDPVKMKDARSLVVHKKKLYAVGAPAGDSGYVLRYTGSIWTPLNNEAITHPNGAGVSRAIIFKDELYIFGYFDSIGGRPMNKIAKIKLQNEVNFAPDAVTDRDTTFEDTAFEIPIRANDTDSNGDYLLTSLIQQAKHGYAVVTGDDHISYTPDPEFSGLDTIRYKVCDQGGLCDSDYVYIVVTPVNDVPIAVNDTRTTKKDSAIIIDVQENDSDADHATFITSIVTQGSKGSATVLNNDSIQYTPTIAGNDTLIYRVCDGGGACDTAKVFLIINQVDGVTFLPDQSMNVYPNPASSFITLQFVTQDKVEISLYDMTGSRLMLQTVTQKENSLDISPLPPGMYLLQVVTSKGTYQQKFIKQ